MNPKQKSCRKWSKLHLITVVPAFAVLNGCSSNTVFDDGSYRPIGSGAPQGGAITEPLAAHSGYVADAGDQTISPIALANRANNERHQNPGHLVRYGHAGIIDKIVKTTRIHCQPVNTKIRTDQQSYWGEHEGNLTQCSYQFPDHCGSHRFAVIEYADKLALVYLEPRAAFYVIDLLKGSPAAQPGLWDKDDRIGSKANNMGYMLETNYNSNYALQENAPLHLGWIIQASYDDELTHGRHYHQAITDIVQCF